MYYFVGENLNINYLSPYLEFVGSDFIHRVNFARTRATTATLDLSAEVKIFFHVINLLGFKRVRSKNYQEHDKNK